MAHNRHLSSELNGTRGVLLSVGGCWRFVHSLGIAMRSENVFFFFGKLPFLFTVDDEENQTKGIVCILNPDRLNALVLLWSI